MHTKELFQDLAKGELAIFVRVFEALPEDKLDWRPHDRSKSALELVQSMAQEAVSLTKLLKTSVLDFGENPGVNNAADAAAVYQREFPAALAAASDISDEDWATKVVGMEGWREPIGLMAIHLLLDFIHHRGQLSTYIRPMGGKVPSIYGPSGDSK